MDDTPAFVSLDLGRVLKVLDAFRQQAINGNVSTAVLIGITPEGNMYNGYCIQGHSEALLAMGGLEVAAQKIGRDMFTEPTGTYDMDTHILPDEDVVDEEDS